MPFKMRQTKSFQNQPAKVSIIGTESVGKTSLLMRITKNDFVETHPTTSMSVHPFPLNTASGLEVTVNFWDTAGQERFKGLAPMYYHGCSSCIAVFDVSNADQTFTAMLDYVRIYRDTCGAEARVIVAANKTDLLEDDTTTIMKFMEECEATLNAKMFCTSAKTGEGVADLVGYLVEDLADAGSLPPEPVEFTPEKKSCC